jgi:GT2 family glycosyltransferase
MKLSIIVLCWNDLRVIGECLKSIFDQTSQVDFEVIISDNGSADGSVEFVREHFPNVRVVENGANLGFAKGNNAGIKIARGDYVLILNPDTIIRGRALEKLVAFADCHPEAGAFGCRVLNPDGSFQNPARPIPTVRGWLLAALCLRWLGRLSVRFASDLYPGWNGCSEREIGFQSGCCVLFRGDVLRNLGGFDEQFFYHFEESDLCARVWSSGSSVLYFPGAEIIHLGGQSVGRFPIRFALETYRSGYRFFYKHYGRGGLMGIRRVYLLRLYVRQIGYSLQSLVKSSESLRNRLAMYRVAIKWNRLLDPMRFVETGQEPDLGYEPLAPAPKCMKTAVLPRERDDVANSF